jgi:Bacterial surface proteins containing Ig-like domains
MKLTESKRRISIALVITLLASLFAFVGSPVRQADAADTFDLGLVALKSVEKNKYVRVSTSNTAPVADSDKVWTEELFVLAKSGSYYTLKSNNTGKYLTVNSSSLTASSSSGTDNDQQFSITANTDGTVSFKSRSQSTYISASSSSLSLGGSTIANAQKFKLASFRDTIRILEVTESGESDLSAIVGSSSPVPFTIDTYSMKEFVASRDDLDGKYDAVYIGKGTLVDKDNNRKTPYSMSLLDTQSQGSTAQKNNHNTSSIQNDITQLKVDEITNDFIAKGLPVIFYNDSASSNGIEYQADLSSSSKALLKKNFLSYKNGNTANVIFVNSSNISSAASFMSKTNLLEKANIRPQLTVTSKPTDYTANQSSQYQAGDKITFNYTIDNVGDISQKNIEVNLYISTDSALPFGAEQLVAAQDAASANGTISYTLPKGYSGIQYWRLEAVDFNTKLKDYATGVYRFQDQKINIKVLQVMPTDSNASTLKDTNNMTASYLAPTSGNRKNAYNITIDVMNMTTFNSTGYTTLNGKYDMLIFGFGDIYNNNAPINDKAAAAVIQFINTGQSVMFTHDTIYNSSNSSSSNWLNKFQTITGQIAPRTDLGLGAPESSTTTEKVNNGLLTQFPFLLSDTTKVATTHNQYYTLNLEDPTVIPWYNMSGGKRTSGDSWNSYYTYSKKNVTYSGSGHTNSKFPDWEQQLFVNTMYRAYIGSNHAPQLTVNSPVEYKAASNNFIPSYQNILLNYQVDDFDLGDRELKTSVNFIYNNESHEIFKDKTMLAGGTINEQIANPLPNGGNLQVQIIAKDKSGAEVSQTINVKIVKVESNIDLSRTVSSNVTDNRVQTNTTATFTYTVTPKAIAASSALSADKMKITNITFSETLPAKLEVTSLPPGMKKSGSADTGYTVSGTLDNITYTLSGNSYTASPVSFQIGVKPTADGLYPLQNAVLRFNDIGEQSARSLTFPGYVLEAVTRLTSLSLNDTKLLVGDSRKMIPVYAPANATYGSTYIWESDSPSIVKVDSSGILTGLKIGTAKITIRAIDGSGLTATAAVNVIENGLNIVGPSKFASGDTVSLKGELYTPDYERITSSQWSIVSGSSSISLSSATSDTVMVTGKNVGDAKIHLKVTTDQNHTYEKDLPLTIYKKVTSIALTNITMIVGSTYQLNPVVSPTDATDKSITWLPSSNSSAATVNSSGLVTAVDVGKAVITAQAKDGSGVTGSAVITVIDPVPVISGPDTIELGTDGTLSVDLPPGTGDAITSYTWTAEDGTGQVTVKGSTSGKSQTFTGKKAGKAKIKVTVNTKNGKTYSVEKEITVKSVTLRLENTYRIQVGKYKDLFDALASSPAAGKTNIKSSLQWTSSNTSIATVDINSGRVTGVKAGTVKVTVIYNNDPAIKAETTIIVERSTSNGEKY